MFHRRFIHFLFGAKEKLQNAPRFEMDLAGFLSVEFFHVLSRFYLRERFHDPGNVTQITLKG